MIQWEDESLLHRNLKPGISICKATIRAKMSDIVFSICGFCNSTNKYDTLRRGIHVPFILLSCLLPISAFLTLKQLRLKTHVFRDVRIIASIAKQLYLLQ